MMASRVLAWLGWAGLEAVCRLGFLLGSTAVFSRYLDPQDFGVVAIVVVAMTLASVCAGIPFEQPLAQHVGLRRSHVDSAFTASMIVAGGLFLLSFPAGALAARSYEAPNVAVLMPIAAASIFFSAYFDILRGIARRQRRFTEIALASLIGHAAGIATALVMLFVGFGVLALLAQRVLVIVFQAVAMGFLAGYAMRLRLSLAHLRDLQRYASLQLVDRLAENVNYFAFNYVVAGLYGLTVLGYVNMAQRFVEPIRGVFLATAHNLAFYYFASAAGAASSGRRGYNVLWRSALATSPVFFGLAAILPFLLPILVGAGWELAAAIAIFLCIGSAIVLPSRLVYTSLAANGRPEYGVAGNILGALATLMVLVTGAGLSPLMIGAARVVGDGAQAILAVVLPRRIVGWDRKERLFALMPGWVLAAGMALVVAGFTLVIGDLDSLLLLGFSIALGVGIYVALLWVWAGTFVREVVDGLRGERRA